MSPSRVFSLKTIIRNLKKFFNTIPNISDGSLFSTQMLPSLLTRVIQNSTSLSCTSLRCFLCNLFKELFLCPRFFKPESECKSTTFLPLPPHFLPTLFYLFSLIYPNYLFINLIFIHIFILTFHFCCIF